MNNTYTYIPFQLNSLMANNIKKKLHGKDEGKIVKKAKKETMAAQRDDDESVSPVRHGIGHRRLVLGEMPQEEFHIIPSSPASSSSSTLSGSSSSSLSSFAGSSASSVSSMERKEYSDHDLMDKFNFDMPASLTIFQRHVRNTMWPSRELIFPLVGNVFEVKMNHLEGKAIQVRMNSDSAPNVLKEVAHMTGVSFYIRANVIQITFWKTQKNGQKNICVIQDQDKNIIDWSDLQDSRIVARVVIQVYGETPTASLVPLRIRRVSCEPTLSDRTAELDEPDL
jgi:hypothetical protein